RLPRSGDLGWDAGGAFVYRAHRVDQGLLLEGRRLGAGREAVGSQLGRVEDSRNLLGGCSAEGEAGDAGQTLQLGQRGGPELTGEITERLVGRYRVDQDRRRAGRKWRDRRSLGALRKS